MRNVVLGRQRTKVLNFYSLSSFLCTSFLPAFSDFVNMPLFARGSGRGCAALEDVDFLGRSLFVLDFLTAFRQAHLGWNVESS